MRRHPVRHTFTRRASALVLVIGVVALMFLVADIGRATPLAQQSGTDTPAAEEEATVPAEEETATPSAEEETTAPAAQETASAEEETIELDITATPQAETTAEPASEATPSAATEKSDAAPTGTPAATPEPLSDEELVERGSELFSKYCAACHQPDGQGIPNAYPPLDGNAFVLTEDPAPVLRVVFTGRAGMPHFRNAFSDQEIASVVSFVRNAWSNEASVVTVEEARTIEEEIYSPSEPMEHNGSAE